MYFEQYFQYLFSLVPWLVRLVIRYSIIEKSIWKDFNSQFEFVASFLRYHLNDNLFILIIHFE